MTTYKPRATLRPKNLDGISEDQIAQHWALYEGYVKNVNLLNGKISDLSRSASTAVEFAELKRRCGFEYNGMLLHEYYFEILGKGLSAPRDGGEVSKHLLSSFGGFEGWKKDFRAVAQTRGTGWVILYYDRRENNLMNFWVDSHEHGHPAGFAPIVVMDVWEHAYMVDSGATGRPGYIENFLKNIDWSKVETNLLAAMGVALASPN